ncbi:MAG: YCF48-related protein [Deltaproteobacteria bacterium]|nr:YCF48-related protein [Deltaproteobacteria bacterium]
MIETRGHLSLLRYCIHHLRCSPTALLPALFLCLCLTAQAAGDTKPAVQAPLAATTLLLDATTAGDRIIAVGQRGHILLSDDGETWKQAQVPVRALLTAVHMHDAATGWAVGHDAVILRTDDTGDTWRLVHRAPDEERPLLDVWFRDKETGFAVGAYGYFLATRDGGATWTSRAISQDDFHLNEIVPAGAERLFLAAEAGVVYRSDDGGGTWRELASPYTGSWYGALVLDADRLLLLGLRGHLFRSEDAGASWTRVATDTTATLTDAARLPSGHLVLTGLEGVILTSRDGGRSVSTTRLRSRQGIASALALPDGGVLLTGEFGVRRLSSLESLPKSE